MFSEECMETRDVVLSYAGPTATNHDARQLPESLLPLLFSCLHTRCLIVARKILIPAAPYV